MKFKKIKAEETRAIRHEVLRPNQTLKECVYPGDDDPTSFHVGGFDGDQLVCIASFFPQKTRRLKSKHQYRLRGMATLESHRGKGYGAKALKFGEDIARKKEFKVLWCNARTSACPYYEKQEYTAFDDVFEIEGIGPHKVMFKSLMD